MANPINSFVSKHKYDYRNYFCSPFKWGGCFSFLCNITVYTSTISMSSMDFPADFRAALDAGAGPMPIIFGSQPVKL